MNRLTSPPSPSPDEIFELLYVRLACLVLLGAQKLAVAEAGSIGDLNGDVYRVSSTSPDALADEKEANPHESDADPELADPIIDFDSILPWELRLLATYLQHSPSPRLVSAYYDLATYARHQYSLSCQPHVNDGDQKLLWKSRLRDLGVRVANALVEMRDWGGARRHLQGLRVGLGEGMDGRGEDEQLRGRIALVCVRVGDLKGAREVLELGKGVIGLQKGEPDDTVDEGGEGRNGTQDKTGPGGEDRREEEEGETERTIYAEAILPLISVASGSYDFAHTQLLASLLPSDLAQNNQAVSALYAGRLGEARGVLEGLFNRDGEGKGTNASKALLFNLSTVYELATDRSRNLKMGMAEKIAAQEGGETGWERAGSEFKL